MALEAWLSSQPQHRGTPLLTAATALAIALEAHPSASGHKRKVLLWNVAAATCTTTRPTSCEARTGIHECI